MSAVGRRLVVNADDLGLSTGVNRGIGRAHAEGIVTSASVMVRCEAAAEVPELSRRHPRLGLGLHVHLGEWVYESGAWQARYLLAPLDDPAAVEREVQEQLGLFWQLLGRDPDHLDAHQHVHLSEPVTTVMRGLADDLSVPLRHYAEDVRYCGDFYGQDGKGHPFPAGITVDHLLETLAGLPAGQTELACHPGLGDADGSPYAAERSAELETLCDARVRVAIDTEGIRLCSFSELKR